MGEHPILKVGSRRLRGMNYNIPYSWCMLFDSQKPMKGIYTVSGSSVKKKLESAELTLESVEKQLHMLTGIIIEDWQKYRKYSLNGDEDTLQDLLIQHGYDFDDYKTYIPNTIQELEMLEDEGLDEIVFLYRMLLAIESENPQLVQLDVNDFNIDFQKNKPFDSARESFVNKITAYEYLFTHIIACTDRQSIILKKIASLNGLSMKF